MPPLPAVRGPSCNGSPRRVPTPPSSGGVGYGAHGGEGGSDSGRRVLRDGRNRLPMRRVDAHGGKVRLRRRRPLELVGEHLEAVRRRHLLLAALVAAGGHSLIRPECMNLWLGARVDEASEHLRVEAEAGALARLSAPVAAVALRLYDGVCDFEEFSGQPQLAVHVPPRLPAQRPNRRRRPAPDVVGPGSNDPVELAASFQLGVADHIIATIPLSELAGARPASAEQARFRRFCVHLEGEVAHARRRANRLDEGVAAGPQKLQSGLHVRNV
mmetsp:Transcript_2520/g.7427  ORF Transcript_2520/g.7427 Transcript_2520/m.7427 type:complete len:271 (-) Transcript_2520:188-1000(-)